MVVELWTTVNRTPSPPTAVSSEELPEMETVPAPGDTHRLIARMVEGNAVSPGWAP